MKKLIVVLFMFVFVSPVISQLDLRPDLIVSPVKLSFDGEKSFFESPALVGVTFDLNLFGLELQPGLYSSFSINTNDGDGSDFKLGIVPYVKLYRSLGVGVYYDFWIEGSGVEWFSKERTGFVIGLDVSL